MSQDFARTDKKTTKSTEMSLRTIQDQTEDRTLKNCITLYDTLQDLARPFGPYTNKEDYTKPCMTIQNQREQYYNTAV